MPEATNITQITDLPPQERAAKNVLLDQGVADLQGPGRQFFPGANVAQLTPEQLAGLDMLTGAVAPGGAVATGIEGAQAGQNFAQDTARIFGDPLSIPGVGDFRESLIGDASRALSESLLPQLRTGAITGGGFGGSRNQIAEALATERVAGQAADALAKFDTDLFGQLLQANTAALDRSPQIAALGLLPGQTTTEVGNILQRQNQAQIAGDRERFEFGQNEPFFLQDNLRATLGLPAGTSTSGRTSGGGATVGELLAGGAATLAGLGAFDDLLNKIPGVNID